LSEFYIWYIIVIVIVYFSYLNNKLKWLIDIRKFIYYQCDSYVEKVTKESLGEAKKTFSERTKREVRNTTLEETISLLRIKSFHFVLLNPFNNNIYGNVKNKKGLFVILKSNGFYWQKKVKKL